MKGSELSFALSTFRFLQPGELVAVTSPIDNVSSTVGVGSGDVSACSPGVDVSIEEEEVMRRASNAMFCSRVGPVEGFGESVAWSMSTVDGSIACGSTDEHAAV